MPSDFTITVPDNASGSRQVSFANHAGDYTAPTATNEMEVGTPDDIELDLGRPLATTEAEESAKVDLTDNRAPLYSVDALIESQATPTTGTSYKFYWNASPQATAANGNQGYTTGASAAFTGTPATLAEALAQLIYIGPLVMSADTVAQTAHIGDFAPPTRFGSLVVQNDATGASSVADGNEHIVVLTPAQPQAS